MLSDKEQKKAFKLVAQKDYKKHYPVNTLQELGFSRSQCKKCQTYFWSTTNAEVCGDPSCSGGFRFIGNSPAKNQLTYIDVWKNFAKIFKGMGYTPIERYPVVSRWNPTTDFTIASIAAFQPYVVSGEVKPPANPLVIPQFCLRFGDIDNVGITGHNVGFVMMGQHLFVPPKEYNPEKYLREIYTWLDKGLGIPKNELTFHEDAWAGGGNFGPCIEFFSRGLEIGNQVYMQYEQTPTGSRDLKIKVLDMGEGQERAAWFTQGTSTNYEATFPTVIKKLLSTTGAKLDTGLLKKFLPYSSYLNVDEVDDLGKAWKDIALKLKVDEKELKNKIMEAAVVFSIGEHSRALLVAINDGALPSNTGGGYNLRVIYRRMAGFMDKNSWNIDMHSLVEEHARYLKPIFPELTENLNEVYKILDVEKSKYLATKQKTASIVSQIIQKDVNEEKLIELYDSHGVLPDMIKDEAKKLGKDIKVPDDFYAKVASRHEKKIQEHETKKEHEVDVNGLNETKALYFDDYTLTKCKAKILKIDGKFVVLDQTVMYPTSGGQLHDLGKVNGINVISVFKQGKIIIHELSSELPKNLLNKEVEAEIEWDRRKQLAQHHTATHIVNAAARKVLGKHINQAGAKKTVEKAHIDLTHYQSLTEEEVNNIEKEANNIIKKSIPIKLSFMSRDKAEKEYGMAIYQGGAVPGSSLRIVDIAKTDVEACGGTHLTNTSQAELIKILKTTKISDGIVRLEFVAGKAAKEEGMKSQNLLNETAHILSVEPEQVPSRAKELFDKWKLARKPNVAKKDLELVSKDKEKLNADELLRKTAEVFKTQIEHVPRTAKRFLSELEDAKNKL